MLSDSDTISGEYANKEVAKAINKCITCRRAKSAVDALDNPMKPTTSSTPFRVINSKRSYITLRRSGEYPGLIVDTEKYAPTVTTLRHSPCMSSLAGLDSWICGNETTLLANTEVVIASTVVLHVFRQPVMLEFIVVPNNKVRGVTW